MPKRGGYNGGSGSGDTPHILGSNPAVLGALFAGGITPFLLANHFSPKSKIDPVNRSKIKDK